MDFNIKLNARVTVVPRNRSFPLQPPVKSPLMWQNQFGYVSMQCDIGSVTRPGDGINEKGLSIGLLWLADAEYPSEASATPQQPALYNLDFCDWVLGNFDSVEFLQKALNDVTVISSVSLTGGIDILGHYIVTDSESNSLIIKYTNGKLQTYEVDNGVMTNTPPYPWHLNNLVNY